ncbi:MAG: hypothetical protein AAF383_03975 [Cyanobacteria bacterium P01_A01_bin.83]
MSSQIIYPDPIEQAIASIESWLDSLGQSNVLKHYSPSPRSLALLLLIGYCVNLSFNLLGVNI